MEKLAKLPTCSSPAAEIGGMVHKALEEYLLGMPKTCEHALAEHCLKAVIMNDEFLTQLELGNYEVERDISLIIEPTLPPVIGFIDLLLPNYHRGCPIIIDHKTSKTRRYFKSPKELKTDIQMIIYASWALKYVSPDAPGAFVQHNQFAYGNKRDVLKLNRTFISRRRVALELEKIQGIVSLMIRTLERYDNFGIKGMDRGQCKDCNESFGPNSCEFSCMCEGKCDEDGYKANYAKIKRDEGNVTIWDIKEATKSPTCMFKNLKEGLTEMSEDVIIKEREGDRMELASLVGQAREQTKGLTSTWDRREAITKAVVEHVVKSGSKEVMAPSHFIDGAIDPDYMPIITQLKEANVKVSVKKEI